jgi:hypothetical protein
MMAELALVTSNPSENPEKQPWERMEGEPTFWYNRYKRFQGLGPKRTMLAALQQERRSTKAPKSTQNGQKPKPKSVSVPGSWKQASIKWCWVERAQAYDEDKIERIVALMFEDLYSDVASSFQRVLALRNIFTTIEKDFNANHGYMTAEQRIAYYARMQKILQDIASEMKVFDAPTQYLLQRHFAYKEYENYKAPTTPEGFMQLVERSGGMESFNKGLEAEIARRKEEKQLRELIDS